MRISSIIFSSILGVSALGCAAAEQGGGDPEPTDPTNPADPDDPAPAIDPVYSAKIEYSPDSLDLVVLTLREVWDYELTNAGGDPVDVMWMDEDTVQGDEYEQFRLAIALDPLSALNTMAHHDGYMDFVAKDQLDLEIGRSTVHLAFAIPTANGDWTGGPLEVGSGPNGFTGSMPISIGSAPATTPTAKVTADGEDYAVTVEASGSGYNVRWTQVAMGMCLISEDCTLYVTSGGVAHQLFMDVETDVQDTVASY